LFDFFFPGAEGGGLPWERRRGLGFWRGLWATLKTVLFSPLATFRAMRRTGGWKDPLLYALIIGSAAWAVSGSLDALLAYARHDPRDLLSLVLRALSGGDSEPDLSIWTRLITALVKAPVLAVLLPLLAALGGQLCLRIFGGKRTGLALTFAVACYATASAAVLTLVPFCGGIIFFGWYAVVATIGLLCVHRVKVLHALGAVLLPPVAGALLGGALLVALEIWSRSGAAS